MVSLVSPFFYTNGYTHVTIATVSISDNIAAGKIILQLAESTWSIRCLAKRVVMYSVTITIDSSLSTNHKEYQTGTQTIQDRWPTKEQFNHQGCSENDLHVACQVKEG